MKIGILVADADEFAPLYERVKSRISLEKQYLCGKEIHFPVSAEYPLVTVLAVHCGIGKVNAASAAAHLVDAGCDCILNYGLSGGIQGISRGEICVCDRYLEHDFDLSGIGLKRCEKPGQEYIYHADSRLENLMKQVLGEIPSGTAVTGDTFVSDSDFRDFLKTEFDAMSCDMETAAIAYVCTYSDVPFIAVRRISDDAGENATDAYREMNQTHHQHLHDVVLRCAELIAQNNGL